MHVQDEAFEDMKMSCTEVKLTLILIYGEDNIANYYSETNVNMDIMRIIQLLSINYTYVIPSYCIALDILKFFDHVFTS